MAQVQAQVASARKPNAFSLGSAWLIDSKSAGTRSASEANRSGTDNQKDSPTNTNYEAIVAKVDFW